MYFGIELYLSISDVMAIGCNSRKIDFISDWLFGFTKIRILSLLRFVKTCLRTRFIFGMSE